MLEQARREALRSCPAEFDDMPQSVSITFASSLPDEPDDENDGTPAGEQHAALLRSHLAESFKILREPWNEEDYAWEFQVRSNGIMVSILIGKVENEWWLEVLPVAFFGFLRRRRIRAAVASVADAVERVLKGDERFGDVYRDGNE